MSLLAENANNIVKVKGVIVSDLCFSHKTCGKNFYSTTLAVYRQSGTVDVLPVIIREDLIEEERDYRGSPALIEGQLRSLRRTENSEKRRLLYIFVTGISFPCEDDPSERINQIYLDGYLYRKPVLRKTPMGHIITDMYIAVRRIYKRSDYIPCIAWNANAKKASGLSVSAHVCVSGRIQSRDYIKRLDDHNRIKKITYEVSVFSLECKDQDVDISSVSC